MKPFLKWPGNKYSVRNYIMDQLIPGQRYVEPFVGAGGVYSNVTYPSYWINDTNRDLIQVYKFLEAYGELYINACEWYFSPDTNTKEVYSEKRSLFNRLSPRNIHKAVLFVYLNRHCFNGLCRYNSKNKFNTPFGEKKKPYFPRTEMFQWRYKLTQTQITCLDFEEVLSECGEGDVVYCDPPYYPISQTSSFVGYTYGWNHDRDLKRLLVSANAASERGAHVVISNSHTKSVVDLYGKSGGRIVNFQSTQNMAADGDKRGKRQELALVLGGSN